MNSGQGPARDRMSTVTSDEMPAVRPRINGRQKITSFLLRPGLLWCATLAVPTAIFFHPAINPVRAMRGPIRTNGVVVQLRPSDHQSVVIEYEVGGKKYRSATSLPDSLGLPRYEEIRPGDLLPIVYNPRYPENGIPGDPEKLLVGTAKDFAMVATGLLVFCLVLEINIRRWTRPLK